MPDFELVFFTGLFFQGQGFAIRDYSFKSCKACCGKKGFV